MEDNKYFTLNNGIKMPKIGLGTYQLSQGICAEKVKQAIDLGYTMFDTAPSYDNEREVGEGIRLSNVPRDKIFVITKVHQSGYEAAKKSIEESLSKFGFPYFDLILHHWSVEDDIGTYRAIEEAYKQNKCRAIGVSNFNEKEFLNIYNNFETKPAVNQIETHIYFNQNKMHYFLKNYNCIHQSYSPFGGTGAPNLENETLKEVAEKYDKSPAQITLNYLLENNIIVIPRTENENKMEENLDVFDFKLEPDDRKKLALLDTGRGNGWPKSMEEEFY